MEDNFIEYLKSLKKLPATTIQSESDMQKRTAEEELEGKKQDRKQRKKFANWIFWVVVLYLIIVLFILCSCGYGCFYISDSVLITLLGTTTANVLGLFAIVAKYLFHN